MPNGRWTTKRVGSLTVESGQAAILDPLAFGDLLGIDHETARRALHVLVQTEKAYQWHAMNNDYEVVRHDLDHGGTAYEVRF